MNIPLFISAGLCLCVASCKKDTDDLSSSPTQEHQMEKVTLDCGQYGSRDFTINNYSEAAAQKLQTLKVRQNWNKMWSATFEHLDLLAENYAYGETNIDKLLNSPSNTFCIGVHDELNTWYIEFNVATKHDSHHSFYIEYQNDKIVACQHCY